MKLEQLETYKNEETNNINDFFDASYSKIYSELLNVELPDQVNFLEQNYFHSNNDKEFRALDFCCGTGRHLKELSNKGYSLDGVDLNPEAIDTARKNLTTGTVYLSDVQFFQPDSKYDLIYSMESSIGYLPDDKTIDILKNVKNNLLSDNGLFVLHLTNRDYLIKNLNQRVWFGNPKTGFLLEDRVFNLTKGTLDINQIRIIDGINKKYSVSLRLYSLKEIKYLLNEAGLSIANVYGDYNNSSYNLQSPYMIIEYSMSN